MSKLDKIFPVEEARQTAFLVLHYLIDNKEKGNFVSELDLEMLAIDAFRSRIKSDKKPRNYEEVARTLYDQGLIKGWSMGEHYNHFEITKQSKEMYDKEKRKYIHLLKNN